jgi:hypothetical protein
MHDTRKLHKILPGLPERCPHHRRIQSKLPCDDRPLPNWQSNTTSTSSLSYNNYNNNKINYLS